MQRITCEELCLKRKDIVNHHVPTLQKLIRQLQRVPYLASKNVFRVAAYFLTSDAAVVEQLCKTILDAKRLVRPCKNCFNWAENNDYCFLCTSEQRVKNMICVVETWFDLQAIEHVGEFRGLYHVLGGALCPLEGVGPDQLTIQALLQRVECEDIKEIIFATNPTPEGEATANFIASKIKHSSIKISKLASGVPVGSSLEHMDRITIAKALLGRQEF